MITMENVCKSYRVAKRNAGFGAACKALFHREYEVIEALKDISFTIGNGEMVGYIGPNGAGKSSTIKILSGILTPDRGKVSIDGRILWSLDESGRSRKSQGEKYRRIDHVRQIGVVFGQRSQLWWDVPVIDSYELLRDIYSIPTQVYQKNLEELTESLALTELLRTPARQLSLGQRMRCLPPAQPGHPVPGRAHHRAGRGIEACGAGFREEAEPGARHHRHPHHP